MSPLTPISPRGPGAERLLIARIATALGLALLLVIGAWSTSHGHAESHAGLCIAAGSPSAASTTTASTTADASADAVGTTAATHAPASSAIDAGAAGALSATAALCGVLLVLLLRRLRGEARRLRPGRIPRGDVPRRARPLRRPTALTLIQLSLSRT